MICINKTAAKPNQWRPTIRPVQCTSNRNVSPLKVWVRFRVTWRRTAVQHQITGLLARDLSAPVHHLL
ncbi:hypothetical protein RSAG8_05523, partial [Rhizoctonia solani AG-8 WAC10335]